MSNQMKNHLDIGTIIDSGKPMQLSPQYVTSTAAAVGVRGSGKTNSLVVITEEMLAMNMQVVIIDPLDVWWGLRSDASGKGPGLPIVVMGGEHGDLPLQATHGHIIADFLVEHSTPAVLSLRHLSKNAQRQFVAAFAERLYELKGKSGNRSPVHLVIDEADLYAPQMVYPGTQQCFGAIDDLVRRGRSSGIGVSVISQRTAKINKDVLSQADTMIALRLVGPHDRRAMDEWVQVHDDGEKSKLVMSSLHQLKQGEAWIWSPTLDVLNRVKIRPRWTFDSSATPKFGDKIVKPKALAAVDIEGLKSQMAESLEQAKANDPAVLKRQILDLQKQLQAAVIVKADDPDPILLQLQSQIKKTIPELRQSVDALMKCLKQTDDMVGVLEHAIETTGRIEQAKPSKLPSMSHSQAKSKPATGNIPDVHLNNTQKRILAALIRRQEMGYPTTDDRTIATLVGLRKTGTFGTYLSAMKTAGLLDGTAQDRIITGDGVLMAGDIEALPTGQALIDWWKNSGKLNSRQCEILDLLVKAYPATIHQRDIAEKLGITNSGTFGTYISNMRSLGVAQGSGEIKASEVLMSSFNL